MPFDGITAQAVAESLNARLGGGRIGKIHQPGRDTLLIQIRAGGANHRLLLSTNPAAARVQLTERSRENPEKAPMFCMLLRKHLSGAHIRSVTTPGPERILFFELESEDELGDRSMLRLVVEIMGRHSNLMLLNRSGVIMDAMRHIDAELSRVREIMPAHPYELPPAQNKIPAGDAGVLSRLGEARTGCGRKLENFLLDHLQGFSPLLCREACLRAEIDGLRAAETLSDAELGRLVEELRAMTSLPAEGPGYLLLDPQTGLPLDFTPVRPASEESVRILPSIHDAMDAFFSEREDSGKLQQKRQDMLRTMNRELDTVNRLIGEQVQVMEENAGHEDWRKQGELLTAFLHTVVEGDESVEVPDYWSETGETLRIPLDANLSPQMNAQRFYRRYQKGRSACSHAGARLEKLRAEADWLESVRFALELADTQELLDQVRAELTELGYMRAHTGKKTEAAAKPNTAARMNFPGKPGSSSRKAAPKPTGKGGKAGKKVPAKQPAPGSAAEPLRVLSSDGFEILIGRNNRQNDHLTLKIARAEDFWFHIRTYSGSHVVVRTQGAPVPPRTMEEAAAYAAWYSRARQSGKAEVDWTRIRNVRKPAGGKPGMVIYVNQETIVIAPKEPPAAIN